MGWAETLEDTVRSVADYFDIACLRHNSEDALDRASNSTTIPLINCGNGSDEHPTQTLIDLAAARTEFGGLDGLRWAIIGDLKHMRTAHSLILGLAKFKVGSVRCIAPPGLEMPEKFARQFEAARFALEEAHDLELQDCDAIYVAGLPMTAKNGVSRELQDDFRIDASALSQLETGSRVFCPLPRVDEISPDIDRATQSAFFRQSRLGLSIRMAVLDELVTELGLE